MANDEHIDVVLEGADAIREWRLKNPGKRLDLSNANLNGENLRKANLKEADLTLTSAVTADFTGANLAKAVLDTTELDGAVLRGAILRGATLCYADLTEADLTGADMRRANLKSAKLCKAIMRDANLRGAKMLDADLYNAELEGANLEKADLRGANLVGAQLMGATLVCADLRHAVLVGTVGHCANVARANLTSVRIAPPENRYCKVTGGGFLDLASTDGLGEAVFNEPSELTRYIEAAFDYTHNVDPQSTSHPIAFRKLLSKLHVLHQLYETQKKHSPELIDVVQTITFELLKYLKTHPSALYSLKPRQFEEIIAEILASFGWQVTLTPVTKDGGFDLYAITKETSANVKTSWIIECKKYARANKVGVDIIRSLWGVKQDLRVANAMLATTSHFTEGVEAFKASRYDLELRDYEGVVEWLNNYQPNPNGNLYIKDDRLVVPGQ